MLFVNDSVGLKATRCNNTVMNRRTYVRALTGGTLAASLGGCLSRDTDGNGEVPDDDDPEPDPEPDENELDGTFRVGTHRTIGGTDSIWEWLAAEFEAGYPNSELDWAVPEAGLTHYVEQADRDATIGADVFFGLTPSDLVRIDERLGDEALFYEIDPEYLDHVDQIRPALDLGDPANRVVPVDVDYVGLAASEDVFDPPASFEDLLEPEYADALAVPDPRESRLGEEFLLQTIDAYGDEYLEYWSALLDNGARIRSSCAEAYEAFAGGEQPLVVSYATELGGIDPNDGDPSIVYLDDRAYMVPGGVGIFRGTELVDLAYTFVEFLLSEPVQLEFLDRGGRFPVVERVSLDDEVDSPITDEETDSASEVDTDSTADQQHDSNGDDTSNTTVESDSVGEMETENDDADTDVDSDDVSDHNVPIPPESTFFDYQVLADSLVDWVDAWDAEFDL